jgi:hypothetical protein
MERIFFGDYKAEIPVTTCITAITGTVLPQVGKTHTVPVTVRPTLGLPRFYPHPCYTLVISIIPLLSGEGPPARIEIFHPVCLFSDLPMVVRVRGSALIALNMRLGIYHFLKRRYLRLKV